MTQKQKIFSIFFIALPALALLLAADLPRFLAYAPATTGLLGAALYYFSCGEKPPLPRRVLIFIVPLLALAAASSLWAIDPGESLSRAGKLGAIMIPAALLIGLAGTIKTEWLRPFAWMIPAAVLAGATLISVELFFDAPVHRLFRGTADSERVYDFVFNRGASTYVICLAPALAILRTRINPRMAYELTAVIFAAMALSVESQSAQLALVLSLIFMFGFPYARKSAWIALGALIAILIAAAPFLAIWAFANFAETLNTLPFLKAGQGFAGARLEIWDYVSRYALQKPLTGYGLEASRVIKDFDSAQIYQEGTSILHPHNFALQLWLEFGVLGAAAGIAFCLGILRAIYGLAHSQARIALPVFIAALSIGSTGYGLWQSWWVGLLFLAAALCILAGRIGASNDS